MYVALAPSLARAPELGSLSLASAKRPSGWEDPLEKTVVSLWDNLVVVLAVPVILFLGEVFEELFERAT